jgi:hypothetical protein
MQIAVSGFGLLIVAVSALGVIQPQRLMAVLAGLKPWTRYTVAVAVRLVMGVTLLAAAACCRWPNLIQGLGLLSVAAALGVAVVGPRRLDSLVQWWLGRTPGMLRGWCLVGISFGGLLVDAAL